MSTKLYVQESFEVTKCGYRVKKKKVIVKISTSNRKKLHGQNNCIYNDMRACDRAMSYTPNAVIA